MTQLSLPASLVERAEAQAAEKGYASVLDYVADLLERDANPFTGQEELVEDAILEALASGPGIVMTEERWQKLYDGLDEAPTLKTSQ